MHHPTASPLPPNRTQSAGSPCDLAAFQPKELSFEIEAAKFRRPEAFEARRDKQIQLPAFPTTSIGSFPQTAGALMLLLLGAS
jgi:hypothetical protein